MSRQGLLVPTLASRILMTLVLPTTPLPRTLILDHHLPPLLSIKKSTRVVSTIVVVGAEGTGMEREDGAASITAATEHATTSLTTTSKAT